MCFSDSVVVEGEGRGVPGGIVIDDIAIPILWILVSKNQERGYEPKTYHGDRTGLPGGRD